MKVLSVLLSMHERRLARAESELTNAQHALRAARHHEQQCEHDLEQHRKQAPERERALYAQVLARPVTQRELDILKVKLQDIKTEEVALEERWRQAQTRSAAAGDRVEHARLRHAQQTVRTEKCQQMADLAQDAEYAEQQYREELDAEDLPSPRT